jgi:hypothetical protein
VHRAAGLWHNALSVVPAAGVLAGEVLHDEGGSRYPLGGNLVYLPAPAAHAELAAVIGLKPMAEHETDDAHGGVEGFSRG